MIGAMIVVQKRCTYWLNNVHLLKYCAYVQVCFTFLSFYAPLSTSLHMRDEHCAFKVLHLFDRFIAFVDLV